MKTVSNITNCNFLQDEIIQNLKFFILMGLEFYLNKKNSKKKKVFNLILIRN